MNDYITRAKGVRRMPTKQERTLIDLKQGSYVVCLPKPWLRYHNIKPGDKLELITNGKLTIRPKRKEKGTGDNGEST